MIPPLFLHMAEAAAPQLVEMLTLNSRPDFLCRLYILEASAGCTRDLERYNTNGEFHYQSHSFVKGASRETSVKVAAKLNPHRLLCPDQQPVRQTSRRVRTKHPVGALKLILSAVGDGGTADSLATPKYSQDFLGFGVS